MTAPTRRPVALVTGASRQRGIAAAIARSLAQSGWDVAITYWLCWPLRSSAPHLLSVPHHGTGVIRRSRHGFPAAVSAARAAALALLARPSSARMSQTASTGAEPWPPPDAIHA